MLGIMANVEAIEKVHSLVSLIESMTRTHVSSCNRIFSTSRGRPGQIVYQPSSQSMTYFVDANAMEVWN